MTAVTQAISERRSARAYLSRPVSAGLVRDIIEVARRTPSSSNMQPWRLSVMAGPDLDRLRDAVRQSIAANPAAEGAEYKIYAANLKDPYNRRRIKCAEDLYGTVGIPRENKMARLMQFARNFDFYGAPVGMILSIDRTMEQGQWADVGMFLQSILLLAHERGLSACPQAAWAAMHKTYARILAAREYVVFCGIRLAMPTSRSRSTARHRARFVRGDRGDARFYGGRARGGGDTCGLDQPQDGAGCRQQDHDNPGSQFPNRQQQEARQRYGEVARGEHGAGPHRIVERRAKDADDGGVGAAHGSLRGGAQT
jgi:nitroreductase